MSGRAADGKWGDLAPRVISGLAMLALGAAAIWIGGHVFAALGVVIGGLAVWELIRMVRPGHEAAARQEALLAALGLAVSLYVPGSIAAIVLGLVLIVLIGRTERHPAIVGGYAAAIFLGVHGIVALRNDAGLIAALWLVAVVIASDIAGYFAGRLIGGPKFWPRISPKKTWAGTVAGWLGAAAVSLAFGRAAPVFGDPVFGDPALSTQGAMAGRALVLFVIAGIALSFASQMGDIAESALKRRLGVKDSSDLIPGHGGVMDRFDAMLGAALAITLWDMVAGL